MIDREQVSVMIKDIERYLSDLNEIPVESKKDLEGKEKYYAVSMIVFSAMNRAIDIGNEVITGSESIPVPGTYKETFEILAQNGVISPPVAARMTKLMKYRNIIAHEYYRLSTEEVYKLKKDIHEVDAFVGEIKKFLARK